MDRSPGEEGLPPVQALSAGGGQEALLFRVLQGILGPIHAQAQGVQLTAAEAALRQVIDPQGTQQLPQVGGVAHVTPPIR